MLQFPGGKVLNRWLMVTPEEEMLILKQFLRFGETRPIVELMTLQCLEVANHLPDPELKPAQKTCQSNGGTLTMLRNPRVESRLVAGLCGFERNSPSDHRDTVHHFENFPGGLSLLLPFHFGSSAFHCLVPPTKELVPPSKLTQCLRKPDGTKLAARLKQGGGRGEEGSDLTLQQIKDEPALKIKTDPDKLNPPRSLWQLNPSIHNDQALLRGETKQENTTSSSLYPPISSSSSSPLKISQKMRSPPPSLQPLPSFSSSFLCPLPTSTFSSSLHPLPSSSSSLLPLPSSLCSLPSPSPAGGRKGRVCCGVCGKSFYDKGRAAGVSVPSTHQVTRVNSS
uniref:Zinc finger protein basonuclin-2-like n=1 Tax=Acanthochromis polyacanthus TaxID=80966 RepID=A0A3Q1GK98_9TELE